MVGNATGPYCKVADKFVTLNGDRTVNSGAYVCERLSVENKQAFFEVFVRTSLVCHSCIPQHAFVNSRTDSFSIFKDFARVFFVDMCC